MKSSGPRSLSRYRVRSNELAQRLFAPLPARYDRLGALLSLGQDRRWRKAMIDEVVPSKPSLVLDLACGPGGVTRALAERTSARIVGLDLSEEMLRLGQLNVARHGLDGRIALVLARGEQLPFGDATFDAVTFTYLLRYVDDPAATLREIARVVKPGGSISSLEFSVPPKILARTAWWVYTRAVLPVAGLLTGGRPWWDVGRFLGPSITQHYRKYPLPWTLQAWQRAGIDDVKIRSMSLGGGVVISGSRAG
ncbi:MAG: class I SAM-dependent methyltransferase [Acidimicrobiaceae bacterium]|nr:class I SAM-dependent methyltransferase [Acidimicrobiaceae bacterium]